jgi:ABC-type uncharacterized transport system substrate-binding protein
MKTWHGVVMGGALAAVLAGPAIAHPHVWTAMRTSLMVDSGGLITGIRMEWQFDETYSGYALEGLDTDGDGEFGPEEIKPLTVENIESLRESDYFGFMRQGGKAMARGEVTDYSQTYNDGKLTLFFVLPLATPVDPRAGEFQYKIYDPDFFIAFDYVKDNPVELEGTLPTGCAMALQPIPTEAELEQTRNMLAEKGPDWQNDTGEDFGGLFAQAAVVTCGS